MFCHPLPPLSKIIPKTTILFRVNFFVSFVTEKPNSLLPLLLIVIILQYWHLNLEPVLVRQVLYHLSHASSPQRAFA
jgi:hypothetical protein